MPHPRAPMDTDTVVALALLGVATLLYGIYAIGFLGNELPDMLGFRG